MHGVTLLGIGGSGGGLAHGFVRCNAGECSLAVGSALKKMKGVDCRGDKPVRGFGFGCGPGEARQAGRGKPRRGDAQGLPSRRGTPFP